MLKCVKCKEKIEEGESAVLLSPCVDDCDCWYKCTCNDNPKLIRKSYLCVDCYNVVDEILYKDNDYFDRVERLMKVNINNSLFIVICPYIETVKDDDITYDYPNINILEIFRTYEEANDYCHSWELPERQSLEIWDLKGVYDNEHKPLKCFWD